MAARQSIERLQTSLPIMQQLANGSPESRIPRPTGASSPQLRRTSSLRLKGERVYQSRSAVASACSHHRIHHEELFPVITENGPETPQRSNSSLSLTPSRGRTRPRTSPSQQQLHQSTEDWSDVDSVKSYGSNFSTASACDHASFALNGTTWSGRSKRYVVHCSNHAADSEEYLTPTQRAARQVRKFQFLLKEARKEIEEKEREIFRLTKELVELRLYKASLNSPDEKTDSSETATIRENKTFLSPDSPNKEPASTSNSAQDVQVDGSSVPKPRTPDKPRDTSLIDSGHFEDGSMASATRDLQTPACASSVGSLSPTLANVTIESSFTVTSHDESSNANLLSISLRDDERKTIVDHYEKRIEEMHRRHLDEVQLLKQSHYDKVESLLAQLTEVNQRYCETRPALDKAECRARELQAQLEAMQTELDQQKALLADQEERNKQMYLKMYAKGQEAARIEHEDQVLEQAQKNPTKVSVAELLQQLTVTQAELENVKAMYRRILELKNSQGALDPEITLQFLKSAIYYFLTDKENLHGHLNAIESILGFTDSEKLNIDRIYRSARK